MRRTWPPVTRGISRCDPACWRCGLRRLRGSTRTRAAASITRRCCATSAATPTPTCWRRRWGDEITLRRELHHIDMGNRAEFVETLRPRHHAKVCRRAAGGAGQGGRARPCRGHAGERSHPVRPLRGCAEDRGADRPAGGDPRKSRPDLRALGRKGIAAGSLGQRGEVSGPAGDAGAGCHRAERRTMDSRP